MSGGNRSQYVTLGVAALLAIIAGFLIYWDASGLESFYATQAEQHAQQYRDSASVNAQRVCARVSLPEVRECVHKEFEAAREGERREYDLQAQLVTSASTRAMGLAAVIGMAVGILGVGLIYATFAAAREGNLISERIGIAQGRAYLSVAAETFTYDPDGWFDIVWRVTNSGQSPARNVHLLTQGLWQRNEAGIFAQHVAGMGDLAAGKGEQSSFDFDATHHQGTRVFEFRVTAEYETVFEDVKGKDEFLFQAFALENNTRLIIRARPDRVILRSGGRKRERKKPADHSSATPEGALPTA